MSTVTYQRETFASIVPDLRPILPAHFEELALNQDKVPLDPDFTRYLDMESKGILHIFTAREDGTLVGYIIGFIQPHLHYKTTLHYFNDIYYVRKDARANGIGARLFRSQEKNLKALGVMKVVQATKMHQSHQAMFEAMGYIQSDVVMVKTF